MKYIIIPIWIFMVVYLTYHMIKHVKLIKNDQKEKPLINKIKLIALTTQVPFAIIIATFICYNILFRS